MLRLTFLLYSCKNTALSSLWQKQIAIKNRIILLLGDDNEGIKVNVIKFISAFVLTQSLNTMSVSHFAFHKSQNIQIWIGRR